MGIYIVTATEWHMQSDLVAGRSMFHLLLLLLLLLGHEALFLPFRLGCHKLPIAGRRAWVVRACRQCTFTVLGPWVVRGICIRFKCASLTALRADFADLFTATANALLFT